MARRRQTFSADSVRQSASADGKTIAAEDLRMPPAMREALAPALVAQGQLAMDINPSGICHPQHDAYTLARELLRDIALLADALARATPDHRVATIVQGLATAIPHLNQAYQARLKRTSE